MCRYNITKSGRVQLTLVKQFIFHNHPELRVLLHIAVAFHEYLLYIFQSKFKYNND